MMPRAVIFDIDNTLALSKEPLAPRMAELLEHLLERTKVAIISGGKLEQFTKQIVSLLPANADLSALFLLPTSGAALYVLDEGRWRPVYEEQLTDAEAARIEDALRKSAEETRTVDFALPAYGERIEYRGAQVTLSALGQEAPIEEKEAWDPTGAKRDRLRDAVAAKLPGFDVKRGGSTSIDVTKRGVNKAYGIRKLSAHLGIPVADMLYVGDALYPGGNDEVVEETGIATEAVAHPGQTETFIEHLLQSSE
ncbi:MAG TPA: HAD-IIB family hydrolase [Candidatus Paceibacterota bacterium]|nr:HAD-IIB family hydrolase [Candidatus Paceibacterota bacterium]